MKAAYLTAPFDLNIVDRPMPVPAQDEVLVRVKATAICGTDVAIFKGNPVLAHPVVQGHESAGIVEAVGANVTSVTPGSRVIINPAYSCGQCFYCKKELFNLCPSGGLLGRDRDGCFAEYVSIPSVCAIPLPDSIDFIDATSIQALATVMRGWERLESIGVPFENSSVAVIGLGAPGLLLSRLAVLAGAKVFSCTRSQWKLDIARQYGAIPVNPSVSDFVGTVKEQTNGLGADIVIDAAGSPATMQQAIEAARFGATILSFGILHSSEGIDLYELYHKELTLLGTRAMNTKGYLRAISLISQGKIDLKPLVTDRFSLSDLEEYFGKSDKEAGKHLRMVCEF